LPQPVTHAEAKTPPQLLYEVLVHLRTLRHAKVLSLAALVPLYHSQLLQSILP